MLFFSPNQQYQNVFMKISFMEQWQQFPTIHRHIDFGRIRPRKESNVRPQKSVDIEWMKSNTLVGERNGIWPLQIAPIALRFQVCLQMAA